MWAELPYGARPVTVAGRAIVAVAAVRYTPGGVLDYDELLVAVAGARHRSGGGSPDPEMPFRPAFDTPSDRHAGQLQAEPAAARPAGADPAVPACICPRPATG